MYCTGGIRCEKASAYMLHHGFNNVYHLEGGIINYAREVKENNFDSKFLGKNFVFDNRLGERITEDIIATCHQCGRSADSHTNCATTPVISYLFNALNARQNLMVAVLPSVKMYSICP